MLRCVCIVINHWSCQNVLRTSVTNSATLWVPCFCSYHIWPHQWSITELMQVNMESFNYLTWNTSAYSWVPVTQIVKRNWNYFELSGFWTKIPETPDQFQTMNSYFSFLERTVITICLWTCKHVISTKVSLS